MEAESSYLQTVLLGTVIATTLGLALMANGQSVANPTAPASGTISMPAGNQINPGVPPTTFPVVQTPGVGSQQQQQQPANPQQPQTVFPGQYPTASGTPELIVTPTPACVSPPCAGSY